MCNVALACCIVGVASCIVVNGGDAVWSNVSMEGRCMASRARHGHGTRLIVLIGDS